MNKYFIKFQKSINNKYLEEAADNKLSKTNKDYIKILSFAACICLIVGGIIFGNLKKQVTVSEANEMGYNLQIPYGSDEISCSVNKDEETASAVFTFNNERYELKSMKFTESDNDDYSWETDEVNMNYSESDNTVSWSVGDGNMWLLTAETNKEEIFWTAEKIINLMGYDMSVAPENADNITYTALIENDLAIGETKFEYNGKHYTFRMASTGDISPDFADISGCTINSDYTERKIRWCPAKTFSSENGSKIIWFDVVPGLLYSLTSEDTFSEDEIYNMADQIFTPAQGDD